MAIIVSFDWRIAVVRIRQVDISVLDQRKQAAPKELTPKQRERLEMQSKFERMLRKLYSTDAAFEVQLDKGDNRATVRQRLLKVAGELGKDIVVRQSERGFIAALATDERRSRRGRRPKEAA